jgi:uncharacterized protein YceK
VIVFDGPLEKNTASLALSMSLSACLSIQSFIDSDETTSFTYIQSMFAHYESPQDKALLKKHFGIDLPSELVRRDVWPGYMSTFVRRHPHADVGDDAVPEREALIGSFGLIPHWSKDDKIARRRDGAQLHDADDQRQRTPVHAQLPQTAGRETLCGDLAAQAL